MSCETEATRCQSVKQVGHQDSIRQGQVIAYAQKKNKRYDLFMLKYPKGNARELVSEEAVSHPPTMRRIFLSIHTRV